MTQEVRISDDALARALGADALAAAFAAKGAEIKRVSSRGMLWLEPLIEIDGEGYGCAELSDVDAVLAGRSDKHIGRVEEHPFLARQTRLTFARAGRTTPLSLQDYSATGGWEGLARARDIGPQRIIDEISQSGLRGRGGAGFPTGIKWQTVADAGGGIGASEKYIVANGDEGDSGAFADRMMMEGDPFQLIEGMAIAAHAVGAGQGYIYIRSEYPDAIRKMEAALTLAAEHIAPFAIEVRVGAGAYICGEETSLLNSLEGLRPEVRVKPPLPAIEGLFGKPTVVNNILTLAACAHILRDGGAEQYAALGKGKSRGTMPMQIAGCAMRGGLFEAPFGLTLDEIVNDIAGGVSAGRAVKAVQVGGPLGAYLPPSQFDLPFTYEDYAAADALIGHGSITVFDDSADMAALARFAMQFCAEESCGKCTPCRIGSVRGMEVIERICAGGRAADGLELAPQMHNARKTPRPRAEEIALLEDLCEVMRDGSLCALGGFVPYPVLSALKYWPEDFAAPAGAAAAPMAEARP